MRAWREQSLASYWKLATYIANLPLRDSHPAISPETESLLSEADGKGACKKYHHSMLYEENQTFPPL